jgi:hypothetical protein
MHASKKKEVVPMPMNRHFIDDIKEVVNLDSIK